MNIFEKMAAITAEVSVVPKKSKVVTGVDRNGKETSYMAASEADVLSAVKELEAKYRVYSFPAEREIVESAILTTTWNGKEKKQQFMRLRVVYRFASVDNPSDFIDITTYGDGVDSGDKAPGKAMTYADKYAILKAYHIATDDDPDREPSDDLSKKEATGIQPVAVKALTERCKAAGVPVEALCEHFHVASLDALSNAQHASLNKYWEKVVEKYGKASASAVQG